MCYAPFRKSIGPIRISFNVLALDVIGAIGKDCAIWY